MTHGGNMLRQFVDRAGALYSLPAVAMEVLELTDRPKVDLFALEQCVERDPALTAKILRVVNSSMFGLSREVTDLKQALAMLGVNPLKLLVLGFSLPEALFSQVEADVLARFWRFALVKSVAARQLANRFWRSPPEEAFIAGLLQEIGMLLLVRELDQAYVSFVKSAISLGQDLPAMEDSILGFNHARLSAQLLDSWNLPASLVQAVAQPHEAEEILQLPAAQQTLPQILHVATLIACIVVDDRTPAMTELLTVAERYRQITVEELDAELDQLQEQVEIMADVFAVPMDNRLRYRDILAEAHRSMARVVSGAMADLIGQEPDHVSAAEEQELAGAATELEDAVRRSSNVTVAPIPGTPSVASGGPDLTTATMQAMPVVADTKALADPGLNGHLAAGISTARARRCEVALILTEITNFDEMMMVAGPLEFEAAVHQVKGILQAIARSGQHLRISDSRYASVIVGYDRRQGVTFARRVAHVIPNWSLQRCGLSTPIQCNLAVVSSTLPGRSYGADEFISAAERCLFAASQSGSGSVKSIDLL